MSDSTTTLGDSKKRYLPPSGTWAETQAQLETLINGITTKYPYTVVYAVQRLNDRIEFIATHNAKNGLFRTSFTIDYELLARRNRSELLSDIVKGVITACEDLTLHMGEANTGKYPFIRLWCDRHLSGVPKLFEFPDRNIPGWAYSKFKEKNDFYPTNKSVPSGVLFGSDPTSPLLQEPTTTDEKAARAGIDFDVKEFDMAAATKKKRVVTKPKSTINPSKVRKPLCAVHDVEMTHDPRDGKWKCTEPGCTMVARPKRAADDRSLILGKGGLSLRLIAQGTDVSVVLISDDNIALDVTGIVSIPDIANDFDVVSSAQVASEVGKDFFNIAVEKPVLIQGIKLTVMGADDIAIMEF